MKRKTSRLKSVYHAADIIGPALLAVADVVQIECVGCITEIGGDDMDLSVNTAANGHHGGRTDGAGQDEAVIIVGMLADQIDPSRSADHIGRTLTKMLFERCGYPVAQIGIDRGHGALR